MRVAEPTAHCLDQFYLDPSNLSRLLEEGHLALEERQPPDLFFVVRMKGQVFGQLSAFVEVGVQRKLILLREAAEQSWQLVLTEEGEAQVVVMVSFDRLRFQLPILAAQPTRTAPNCHYDSQHPSTCLRSSRDSIADIFVRMIDLL